MMKGKLLLYSIFLLLIFITPVFAEYNLTPPEEKSLIIDGKKYTFKLYRYDPPYIYKTLYKNKEEADLSTPEGTSKAISSSAGRDREWHLSLFDEKAREKLIQEDKKSGGKILEEYSKNEPLPEDLTKNKLYFLSFLKIEIEVNKKLYALIQEKPVVDGKLWLNTKGYKTYVKQGNIWLSTDDMDIQGYPLILMVCKLDYDELQKICERGVYYLREDEPAPLELNAYISKNGKRLEPPIEFSVIKRTGEKEQIYYEMEELMEITLILKNISYDKRDLYLLNAFYPAGKCVKIHIVDSQDETLSAYHTATVLGYEPSKEEVITLSPAQTVTANYKIPDPEGKTVFINERFTNSSGFAPGKYKIILGYGIDLLKQLAIGDAPLLVNGSWQANPIEITLVEKQAPEVIAPSEDKKQEGPVLEEEASEDYTGQTEDLEKAKEESLVIIPRPEQIELKVVCSKKRYKTGEPIEVSFTIKNAGDEDLYLPDNFLPEGRSVVFSIENMLGDVVYVSKKPSDYQPGLGEVVVLAPEKEITNHYTIADYGSDKAEQLSLSPGRYFLKGQYVISLAAERKTEIWVAELVEFTVESRE